MAVKKSAVKKVAAKSAATSSRPKAPVKKAAAKKAVAKKAVARKAVAKKAVAKKAVAKKAVAKKAVAKKAVAKKAVAKKAAAKKAAAKKAVAKKPAVPQRGAKPSSVTASGSQTSRAASVRQAPTASTNTSATTAASRAVPAIRGRSKDDIAFTKDFDVKFLRAQRELLHRERVELLGSVENLEGEAQALIDEAEMGDVQFDDEGGEGDTMVVERERDLALSAQHREIVADIDAALTRITEGTYGYSTMSGRPIPRERLEAIPWATELVEEKVGGIGRR